MTMTTDDGLELVPRASGTEHTARLSGAHDDTGAPLTPTNATAFLTVLDIDNSAEPVLPEQPCSADPDDATAWLLRVPASVFVVGRRLCLIADVRDLDGTTQRARAAAGVAVVWSAG